MSTRKKVKLEFIAKEYARKTTFNKRKKSLMKKAGELSTLCGIEACAIVFSPYDSEPEVWPSALGVQRVVSRFKKMPEMEQMMNQESFMKERILKGKEKVKRKMRDNYEMEMTHIMFQSLAAGKVLYNINITDLDFLEWLIDNNNGITRRMEALENSQAQVVVSAVADVTAKGKEVLESMERQQWFTDLDLINY